MSCRFWVQVTDTKPKRPTEGVTDGGDAITTAVAAWGTLVVFGDSEGELGKPESAACNVCARRTCLLKRSGLLLLTLGMLTLHCFTALAQAFLTGRVCDNAQQTARYCAGKLYRWDTSSGRMTAIATGQGAVRRMHFAPPASSALPFNPGRIPLHRTRHDTQCLLASFDASLGLQLLLN